MGKFKLITSVLLFLALTVGTKCYSAIEPETYTATGSAFATLPVTFTTLKDNQYTAIDGHASPYGFRDKTITDQVIFNFTNNDLSNVIPACTITANFTLVYNTYSDISNRGSGIGSHSVSFSLVINYDGTPGVVYKDRDVYQLFGGYGMTLTVNSISVSGSSLTSAIQSRLSVKQVINSERYYSYDSLTSSTNYNIPTQIGSYIQTAVVGGTTYLTRDMVFTWSSASTYGGSTYLANINAEYYDLEYTYVNDYCPTCTGGYQTNMSLLPFDFAHNSTLVRLHGQTTYKIPIIFEHGYVICRVRAVFMSGSDFSQFIEGSWSCNDNGHLSDFASSPCTNYYCSTTTPLGALKELAYFLNQDDKTTGGWVAGRFGTRYALRDGTYYTANDQKNWQYTVSFAELGKSKGVVKYFDGTMRDRQEVTRLNSDNKTIVKETIYDASGRPGIEVLPTPTTTSDLIYFYNFNQNSSGTPYNYANFSPVASFCSPMASVMKNTSGAALYYSPGNTDMALQQAYTPDSKGYPFSQTQYTNDNTGRIAAKGGVGPDFQIGSGHETKYYYGTPMQEELDAMFGYEVGNADHYKKNMVEDPNGQVSVSYIDPKGNTIATALAGASATNLSDLPSKTSPASMTVNLLNHNTVSQTNGTITSQQTLLVSTVGNYSFSYNANGIIATLACSTLGKCPHGVYDLTIRVTDACGNILHTVSQTFGGSSLTCGSGSEASGTISFTLTSLPVGTYTVTKILSVDMPTVVAYLPALTDTTLAGTCYHPPSYFKNKEKGNMPAFACPYTCAACSTQLGAYVGNYDNPTSANYLTPAQYNQLYEDCMNNASDANNNSTCQSNNVLVDPCAVGYDAMLMDMSPGGQYGQYVDPNTGKVTSSTSLFPLSIYNGSNVLPSYLSSTTHTWQNPVTPYTEADGSPSYIVVSNTTLAYTGSVTILPTGQSAVLPGQLVHVSDFIANWKPSWAASLVYYHPEYHYYEWCEDDGASNAFDANMLNIQTFSQANTAYQFDPGSHSFLGLMNPNATVPVTPSTPGIDPYFATGGKGATALLTAYNSAHFSTAINAYPFSTGTVNIEQLASYVVNCSMSQNATEIASIISLLNTHPNANFEDGTLTTQQQDAEWIQFRGLYLALKAKFQYREESYEAIAGNYYNRCIGDPNFTPSENGFASTYLTTSGPCGISNKVLFANKVSRFPGINNVLSYLNVDIVGSTPGHLDTVLMSYVGTGTYDLCGKCPQTGDFTSFLSRMATPFPGQTVGNLLNTIDLNDYTPTSYNNYDPTTFADFTRELQTAIYPSSPIPVSATPSTHWWWKPRYYDDYTFAVRLEQETFCCLFTFTSTKVTNWANIVNLSGLQVVNPSTTTASYSFTMVATMSDGSQVSLSGVSSCLNLNCAPAPAPCQKKQEAKDLLTLFEVLKGGGLLTSTSLTNLVGVYAALITPALQSQWITIGSYAWSASSVTSTSFAGTLWQGTNPCNFNFTIPPGYPPEFTISSIVSFMDIQEDPAHPGNFLVEVADASGRTYWIQMSNSSGCFPASSLFDCGDPNAPCTSDMTYQNKTMIELQALMNTVTADHELYAPSTFTLPDPSTGNGMGINIIQDLQQACGTFTNTWASSYDIDTTVLTASIGGCCTITLQCSDPSLAGRAFHFTQIVSFGGMKAYNFDGSLQNASSQYFTITATLSTGINVALKGYISCAAMQVANCVSCPSGFFVTPPPTATVQNCNSILCGTDANSPAVSFSRCTQLVQNRADILNTNGISNYNQYLAHLYDSLSAALVSQFLGATETFTATYSQDEFHYTLYYYDQANNLSRTVPPAGVQLNLSTSFSAIDAYRANPVGTPPTLATNTMVTDYQYNNGNKVRYQTTPDGGTSQFMYDYLERLVVSQNANQADGSNPYPRYSYTLYDNLNRIIEVGEAYSTSNTLPATENLTQTYVQTTTNWPAWIGYGTTTRSQITNTYYDVTWSGTISAVLADFPGGAQQNLRGRVATMTYSTVRGTYDYATHYTYDVHGNVSTIIQENPTLAYISQNVKRVDYYYDLISGKVNQVNYQPGQPDQFTHIYNYDDDNRLISVQTSRDGGVNVETEDVNYYYQHGPLAREEIGDLQLQGLDYAYTLAGWIKGVNSNTLVAANDMGTDSKTSGQYATLHQYFPADIYGYTVSYYQNTSTSDKDYTAIGSSASAFEANISGSPLDDNTTNLYNGNIRHIVTANGEIMANGNGKPQAVQYRYDQLNRIKNADIYNNINMSTNSWNTGTITDGAGNFSESFAYDENGNITTLVRHGTTDGSNPLTMDNLAYNYTSGKNQLAYVVNSATAGNYVNEVKTQSSGNYTYDDIGNLTKDAANNISSITWNVYGKITAVTRTTPTTTSPNLAFSYGPDGNRVLKIAMPSSSPNTWIYTYYVRDAQGNVMATYNRTMVSRISPVTPTDFAKLLYDGTGSAEGAIATQIGTTAYKTFISEAFSGRSWFLNASGSAATIQSIDISEGHDAAVVQTHAPSWYCNLNSTLKTAILADYTDADLTQATLDYGGSDVMNYIYVNNINLQQLLQAFLDLGGPPNSGTNFATFLQQLDQQYGGGPGVYGGLFNTVYNAIYPMPPGPPAPPWPGGYAILQGYYAANPANALNALIDINNYDLTHGRLSENVFTSGTYSTSNLMSGISTANGGSYGFLHTYLTGLTTIIDMLTSENASRMWGYLQPANETTLLGIYTAHDPGGFITNSLGYDLTMPYTIIMDDYSAASYSVANLITDMKTWLAPADYGAILKAVYGIAGDYEERYTLLEQDIYGSKRMGIVEANLVVYSTDFDASSFSGTTGAPVTTTVYNTNTAAVATTYFPRSLGQKQYELTNHLGNVLAVITDKKLLIAGTGGGSNYYAVEVESAQDYYAFGSQMPTRTYQLTGVSGYRYGFNGKEKDDETYGAGDAYDFGARIYDCRLGRWMSVDPKFKKFPGISPYNFAYDNPSIFIDDNGEVGKLDVWQTQSSQKYFNKATGKSEYKTITNVSLTTTIYLYGPDANAELAQKYNSDWSSDGSGTKSADIALDNGQLAHVSINVCFVYDKTVADQIQAMSCEAGEAGQTFDDASSIIGPYNNAIEENGGLVDIDPSYTTTEGHTQGDIAQVAASNLSHVSFHEVGHLLGFDERYSSVGGWPFPDGSATSPPYNDFLNDFMSNQGTQVAKSHFVDLYNYAASKVAEYGKNGQLFNYQAGESGGAIDRTDSETGDHQVEDPSSVQCKDNMVKSIKQ